MIFFGSSGFLHDITEITLKVVLNTIKQNKQMSCIFSGTFVVCRISVMAWMSRWLLINKDFVPLVFYTIGSVGLAVMTVMNIILFYRLLRSDFIKKNESTRKEN